MAESSWRRALLAVACVLASGLVLMASLLPDGFIDFGVRPPALAHFLAYLLLGLGFSFWLVRRLSTSLWVLIGLSLLGLLVELLQTQIPSRSFFWVDAAANAAGALSGVAAASIMMALKGSWRGQADGR